VDTGERTDHHGCKQVWKEEKWKLTKKERREDGQKNGSCTLSRIFGVNIFFWGFHTNMCDLIVWSWRRGWGRERRRKKFCEWCECDVVSGGGSVIPYFWHQWLDSRDFWSGNVCGRLQPDFRIAVTGSVVELDKAVTIVKKLKLQGTPYKIYKNTAFIQVPDYHRYCSCKNTTFRNSCSRLQWRSKFGVGPCARISKAPPLPLFRENDRSQGKVRECV